MIQSVLAARIHPKSQNARVEREHGSIFQKYLTTFKFASASIERESVRRELRVGAEGSKLSNMGELCA